VKIAVVGKYTNLGDTYMSLNEALRHGGVANQTRVELKYVDSESLDVAHAGRGSGRLRWHPGARRLRRARHGGQIAAIRWARENDVPFFGICLGMQLAVVEYCRHVLGLKGAMSREFDPDPAHPVVELMDEQRKVTTKGGTMRLGAYPCALDEGSQVRRIYGTPQISERHRHRYEVNPAYHDKLQGDLAITGWSPDHVLAEMVEHRSHRYFVGCQFHPEFKSRPLDAHPLFSSFHQGRRRLPGGAPPGGVIELRDTVPDGVPVPRFDTYLRHDGHPCLASNRAVRTTNSRFTSRRH